MSHPDSPHPYDAQRPADGAAEGPYNYEVQPGYSQPAQPDYAQQQQPQPGYVAPQPQPGYQQQPATPVYQAPEQYAAPTSGVPVTGGPYPATAAYPTTGAPAAYPTTGAPAGYPTPGAYGAPDVLLSGPKKSKAVPVLAGLLAMFVIVSAVLAVLFVSKSGDYTKSQAEVATKSKTITDTNADLTKAKAEVESLKQQLTGSQNKTKESEKAKTALATCLKFMDDFIAALANNKTDEAKQIIKDMKEPCKEADNYY
ncbi:hypothetical protein Lfu02_46220 [Longispora fulva]|uniref:Uncharacterized protein n=1 Tax=Longispora fulva TaxID=619741 RepID=A0A8J7KQZ1_9ACTN|nr:hypothetical protein [Longispora fulva]MBG6137997.1 hypothetical protein [Longispora fulva]GIG60250.1 hypothetical protein Lfu02_46220 [Longispora fulva]